MTIDIKDRDFKWIDLKFSDLIGNFHHLTLPAKNYDEIKKNGVGFDSSSCPGFKSVEGGDMVLIIDEDSAFIDPFFEEPTISYFCYIKEADTRSEYLRDPRTVSLKAHEYMRNEGIADDVLFGPEFEFYIFDRVVVNNSENISEYRIESYEGKFGFGDGEVNESGEFLMKKSGYHSIPPKDKFTDIRGKISKTIIEHGIDLIYHHHEVGSAQNEVEIKRYPILKTGDNVQIIKYFIKNVCYKNDLSATFMPKPLYNMPGNGMHFHQHLFKDGKNLFFGNGYGGLSQIGEYYVAGLLKHGKSLLAFTNPSTNSYKRLVKGFEAPVKLFYSLANRSAAIRIPKYATSENEKRIEFRPPDATCNPYLATAAMLMAGLDGIKNKISLKDNNFGPFDQDLEKMEKSIVERIDSCPTNLIEALEELKKDHDYLLQGGVFTEDLIKGYIEYKEKEALEIAKRPHPYEFELYF
ncbi:MAG: glnA [candidate division TA06 bacterium 32_111]|uniref:GlnA n=2 Tax=Bacteria candidate phyla TaxID=1783234 RepID=A0A101I4L0_UNCT6|nr:MAG: glnA [candidate division TA06 bacterium 32_111]KUK88213.1 MAG: glnA [candidate division TA06 bacterium 34_109]HAF07146.1 type I glutamate--ammonia ligase [candidate division WOR-3 bacterium]HCP15997.1 type I glutamate--ammonia ligase [candidate division WOR-3 bacterium]